jgi:hypothetical protein
MKCPNCGSDRVYRSRVRNTLERLRQMVSEKDPFRCHDCGWRKWRVIPLYTGYLAPVKPDDLRTGRTARPVTGADLDRLDVEASSDSKKVTIVTPVSSGRPASSPASAGGRRRSF